MSAIELVVKVGFGVDDTFGYYDINDYNDGCLYAPDVGSIVSDIGSYVRYGDGVQIRRGATALQGTTFNADSGTFTCTFDNSDRRFDPTNLAGPYVIGGESKVKPGVPVTVQVKTGGTTYPVIFSGFADGWANEYPAFGKDQTVSFSATDAVGRLSRAQLNIARPAELSGARIDAILDAIQWDGGHAISPGQTMVSALTDSTITAWSTMTDTAEAEWGQLYVDPIDGVTFRDRDALATDPRSTGIQSSFGDALLELDMSGVGVTYDDGQIFNDVTIVYADTGEMVNAQDLGSQSQPWGVQSLNRSLPIESANFAQEYARWIVSVFSEPKVRFSFITLKPRRETALMVQAMERIEGDRISVGLTPKGGGSRIVLDCWIRGVQHAAANDNVTTTWILEDASWTNDLGYYDSSHYDDGSVYGL